MNWRVSPKPCSETINNLSGLSESSPLQIGMLGDACGRILMFECLYLYS